MVSWLEKEADYITRELQMVGPRSVLFVGCVQDGVNLIEERGTLPAEVMRSVGLPMTGKNKLSG
jgi:hypothetical protein